MTSRPCSDSVVEGSDVRIVHRHARSLDAHVDVMHRAGKDMGMSEASDQATQP